MADPFGRETSFDRLIGRAGKFLRKLGNTSPYGSQGVTTEGNVAPTYVADPYDITGVGGITTSHTNTNNPAEIFAVPSAPANPAVPTQTPAPASPQGSMRNLPTVNRTETIVMPQVEPTPQASSTAPPLESADLAYARRLQGYKARDAAIAEGEAAAAALRANATHGADSWANASAAAAVGNAKTARALADQAALDTAALTGDREFGLRSAESGGLTTNRVAQAEGFRAAAAKEMGLLPGQIKGQEAELGLFPAKKGLLEAQAEEKRSEAAARKFAVEHPELLGEDKKFKFATSMAGNVVELRKAVMATPAYMAAKTDAERAAILDAEIKRYQANIKGL